MRDDSLCGSLFIADLFMCLLIVMHTVYLCDSKLFHVSYIHMFFIFMFFIFGILMSFVGGGGVSKHVYQVYLSSSKHKLQNRIKSHKKKNHDGKTNN